MRYIIVVILMCLSTISLAGTIRSDVSDEKYIEYGAKHKCVLRLKKLDKDGAYGGFYGSCTIIAPRVAITAAHVVKGADKMSIVKEDGKEIKVKYSAFPLLFGGDKRSERFDIAVCWLEEPIELNFYPEMYRDKDETNKICSIAGFGVTGTHEDGVIDTTSKKRAGSNYIDAVINGMLVCTVGEDKKTSLEYMIASGDSGGGLFIDKKLAGINSNVSTIHADQKANSDKNDFGCHTRVSSHANWIDECIEVFETIDKGSR